MKFGRYVDVNQAMNTGCTPLIIASYEYVGQADVVELLVDDSGPRCDTSIECAGSLLSSGLSLALGTTPHGNSWTRRSVKTSDRCTL